MYLYNTPGSTASWRGARDRGGGDSSLRPQTRAVRVSKDYNIIPYYCIYLSTHTKEYNPKERKYQNQTPDNKYVIYCKIQQMDDVFIQRCVSDDLTVKHATTS
jgi:hypothetical protein